MRQQDASQRAGGLIAEEKLAGLFAVVVRAPPYPQHMESRAEAYFSAHFPEAVATTASGMFDLIPAIRALSLARIAGILPGVRWEFCPGLNIVCGPSGSGKTRILEVLRKRRGTVVSLLPSPAPRDFRGMSFGQTVMAVGEMLLALQPIGSCLLMDDVLGSLDRQNTERLLDRLLTHDKQVVLTVKSHQCDVVRISARGTATRFLCITLPPQRGQASDRQHE